MIHLDTGDIKGFEVSVSILSSRLRQTFDRSDFDYLVNNAGIGFHASFTETTEDQFDHLFKIHLKGPYFLTRKLLPLMTDGGRIINVSSTVGNVFDSRRRPTNQWTCGRGQRPS